MPEFRDSSETIDANSKMINTDDRTVQDDTSSIDDVQDDRHWKASVRAQRATYNYLNNDCDTVLLCFPNLVEKFPKCIG